MRQAQSINKRKELAALAESQFRDALSRVGSGLEKNANWFLNLRQLNLDALSLEARVTLWHDLLALVVLASRPDASKAGAELSAMEASSWQYLESWPLHRNPKTGSLDLSDDFQAWWQWVVNLQVQVDERISWALETHFPPLQLSDISLQLTPAGLIPVFPLDMFVKNSDRSSDIRGADGAVLVRLSLVLQKYGSYLHSCPACQTIFLATRNDQKFCDAACRSRIGMQRWRNARVSLAQVKAMASRRKSAHRSTSKSKGKKDGTKGRH